jgi:hypothetical protein
VLVAFYPLECLTDGHWNYRGSVNLQHDYGRPLYLRSDYRWVMFWAGG